MAFVTRPVRVGPQAILAGLNPAVLGIGTAALGFFLFTASDTIVKWLSAGYPVHQIIFLNSVFVMIPIMVLLSLTGGPSQLRTSAIPTILVRGLCGMTAALGGFTAFSLMPMADVYAVIFSAPLFITALSVPILKETVGLRRWCAVMVGFVGVMIMLKPGQGLVSIGSVGALVAALGYAASVLIARRIGDRASSAAIVFYSNVVGITVMGAWTAFDHVVPSVSDLALFATIGMLGGTGLICIISAFKAMPAAVIAPFQYTQMVWGVAFGYLIWSDVPDASIALGCAVVIASGLYILHRETKLGRPTLRKRGSATIG